MFSVFARKKHNDHNESQPVIPPGWRAGSPELIHTPLRYPIDHNENQSSHPQNLELFRGHEAYYAILRWCYQKNNCIFGLPDPQNIGLAIFVFALNGSYLKDRKHRPETCMISQPTAQSMQGVWRRQYLPARAGVGVTTHLPWRCTSPRVGFGLISILYLTTALSSTKN